MPETLDEMLSRIQPVKKRETATICLRPDLLDAWEDAQERLAQSTVNDKTGARLANAVSKETRSLADEVQRLEDEIEANQARFVFEQCDPDEWNAMIANHPPRKDNQPDQFYGGNRDAVLDEAIRRCMVEPVIDGDEAWLRLRKACNTSEWTELRNAVNRANGAVVEGPKSELASRIRSSSASGSKRPARGESARGSSTAGSRPKSTSTSTTKTGD